MRKISIDGATTNKLGEISLVEKSQTGRLLKIVLHMGEVQAGARLIFRDEFEEYFNAEIQGTEKDIVIYPRSRVWQQGYAPAAGMEEWQVPIIMGSLFFHIRKANPMARFDGITLVYE